VSNLSSLQSAQSLSDLALLLGFTPSGLAWVLYKLPTEQKYTTFEIPKKRGGVRKICAPLGPLKMLQTNLAVLLYACRTEIQGIELQKAKDGNVAPRKPISHGFRKGQSIIGHARLHQRNRFVLNLDLHDFFPTFNFGRVRGFFIKDHNFALNEKVATVIAQIACFENALPQGSPCSPVIADMVAHILDMRLVRLAKAHRVKYSRYADDLTFSTREKEFPAMVASCEPDNPSSWKLGEELVAVIKHAGFAINPDKTRMQVRPSRQIVTGLTVNSKVNIRQDYSRSVRTMCNALFQTGSYHYPKMAAASDLNESPPAIITKLAPLEGMLSHIHHIKRSAETAEKPLKDVARAGKHTPGRQLFAKFLFYKYFVALQRPLVLYEGVTDKIYLKYAMQRLAGEYPQLGRWHEQKFEAALTLFNYGNNAHKVLDLNGGSGPLLGFINQYQERLARFKHRPLAHPVIILLDNDDGLAKDFRTALKKRFGLDIGWTSSEPFYHLSHNLYLVKTLESGDLGKSCIEDCFDAGLRATPFGGKTFSPDNKIDDAIQYGKKVFAEKVVIPRAGNIDWKGFSPLLARLVAAVEHYTVFKETLIEAA
jgi:RNA-directed DNA polymerase